MISQQAFQLLKKELQDKVQLIAVSKKKSTPEIQQVYSWGQRHFGENYVQEFCQKQLELPNDIQWHFLGHLQRNKVKQLAPFVKWIHSIDSIKLLDTIEKNVALNQSRVNVLIQVRIAQETSKYGVSPSDIHQFISEVFSREYHHICIRGVMGMSTHVIATDQIRKEFQQLKQLFDEVALQALPSHVNWDTLSMGMSGDYLTAIEEGSTMVRIGSSIFGERL